MMLKKVLVTSGLILGWYSGLIIYSVFFSVYRLKNYIGTNSKCRFLTVKPSLIRLEELKTYFL